MRRDRRTSWALAIALAMSTASGALAAPTDPQSCEAALERASGKLASCRLKAEATFAKNALATRRSDALAKCAATFTRVFDKAIARYGVADCPSTPESAFASYLARCSDETTAAARGGPLPTCGDGAVNVAGEQCDGADLAGSSCESLGRAGGSLGCTAGCRLDTSGCGSGELPATGQATCWNGSGVVVACGGTGQDGELQAGAAIALIDNGDGTVTDRNTGLTWEKHDDGGGLHDKDATFSWTEAFAHVADLNAAAFAGHDDWRLPNIRELKTIVDFAAFNPTVAAAFDTGCAAGCSVATCSCTKVGFHWSSTTFASNPQFAWYATFYNGEHTALVKSQIATVRAVRGGL